MRIVETRPRIHLEGRVVSQRAWFIWAILFLPGLLVLLLLPETARFAGLLTWMAIWLASVFLVPRLMGDLIRVTIDSESREIVWSRNGAITRSVPFAEIKRFELAQLATASRPYKTFQLAALLKDGHRITLAVDPKQAEAERALRLLRERVR